MQLQTAERQCGAWSHKFYGTVPGTIQGWTCVVQDALLHYWPSWDFIVLLGTDACPLVPFYTFHHIYDYYVPSPNKKIL